MNDSPLPPDAVPVGQPLEDEDAQLAALFQKLEHDQLTFLDEAGKRIAELCAALLGVLFAVLTLGDQFPPPLLNQIPWARALASAVLAALFLALLAAVWAIRPRSYRRFRHNLSAMQREFQRMVAFKSRWVAAAGILFVAGCLGLAVLVGMVVWQ